MTLSKTDRRNQASGLKPHWIRMSVVSLISIIFLVGCDDQTAKILRGEKPVSKLWSEMGTASQTETQVEDDTSVQNTEASEIAETEESSEAEKTFLKTVTKVKEENKNKDKRPLNLSLPSMSWESMENNGSSRGVLPDVFREIPQESTLNFSGKLLWDESEEARQMPIEDTIKGAEVELQFYLP
ncbi:MAG: hypothetical protein QF808_03855 [Thalassolituus sp.]|nr:hypothetical protein [Thalassolituus sp.]